MKILCDSKEAVSPPPPDILISSRIVTLLCYWILNTKIQFTHLYKQVCPLSDGQCGKKLLPYCQLHLHEEFCSVLHVRRKIWTVFFLFRDTSRYIKYVRRSCNFLCNVYAVRLQRHLLPPTHSHLEQYRNFGKNKRINSNLYVFFFNCTSFQLVLEYRTLTAWHNAILKLFTPFSVVGTEAITSLEPSRFVYFRTWMKIIDQRKPFQFNLQLK